MEPPAPPICDRLLVHYGEIGTKGGNRRLFEEALGRNLTGALRGASVGRFRRESGRLAARLLPEADPERVLARVVEVPGVAWCAPAKTVRSDLDEIRAAVLAFAALHAGTTFRVDAQRADKTFPLDSVALNRALGAAVVEMSGRKVSLAAAEHRYGVEVDRGHTYVYCDRREGPGGLPVGSEGEVVALLSGGLDSPVAAWRMMLRGCRVHLVHFLNRTVSTNQVDEKIDALARRLAAWHGPITLSVLPFEPAQREIVMVVPAEYRMLAYRRMMFRIADEIRRERNALGFVTGDSVGQVASQTLENLAVIHEAARAPVYSPLCGMNKVEITATARHIGTYEISILPHEDCCSFLVARHPATKATIEEVRAVERFDADALARAVLAERRDRTFDPRPPVR